ncbi:hypothetical protein ACQR3P_29125 [Rhodococcus sp. IEGM1300]
MALKPVFAHHDIEKLSKQFGFSYGMADSVRITIEEECPQQGEMLQANRYDLYKFLPDGSELHVYLYTDDTHILAIDSKTEDILEESEFVDTDTTPFKDLYRYLTNDDLAETIEHKEPARLCARCNSEVQESHLERYQWECHECDEDLYDIETYIPSETENKEETK